MNQKIRNIFPYAVAYFVIFLLLVPVSYSIRYWQNDEWVYYPNVEHILNGNWNLHPLTAPTFYSTGVLAALWSSVFGISTLPILTLAVSVASLFLLFLIITTFCNQKRSTGFLFTLLILVNPLFVFPMWGFMTDIYFIFYLLIAAFLYLRFRTEDTRKRIFFAAFVFASILSYFTRQLGILLLISAGLDLLLHKKYRWALLVFSPTLILALFHFFFFPKNGEMLETKFAFSQITHMRYIYSLGVVLLTYLGVFLAPVLLLTLQLKQRRNNAIAFVLTTLIVLFSFFYFDNIGWIGERFYYLKYTVHRNGFFVENIAGPRSQIPLSDQFYSVLQYFGFTLSVFWITNRMIQNGIRSFFNFSTLFCVLYFATLAISVKVYDRYLLPLFFFTILAALSYGKNTYHHIALRRYHTFLILIWVLFWALYSYSFSADYILTNSYIWKRSSDLVTQGVPAEKIRSTDAWKFMYGRKHVEYIFTTQPPLPTDNTLILVEKYPISYPIRLLSPKTIYLYQQISNED